MRYNLPLLHVHLSEEHSALQEQGTISTHVFETGAFEVSLGFSISSCSTHPEDIGGGRIGSEKTACFDPWLDSELAGYETARHQLLVGEPLVTSTCRKE